MMAHTHDGTHTCLNSYTWSSWPWSNGTHTHDGTHTCLNSYTWSSWPWSNGTHTCLNSYTWSSWPWSNGTHTCLNSYTWSSWPWSNGTPHTTWHNTTTTFECDSFHYGTFQSQAWQAWWLALCLLTLNDIAVYIWREKLSTKSLQRLYLERRGRLTNNEWLSEWVTSTHQLFEVVSTEDITKQQN